MDDSLDADYFKKIKERLENRIPEWNSPEYQKTRNKIIDGLKKDENNFKILRLSLKTLILGDWNTKSKKERLYNIRNTLIRNGLYAETINHYYNIYKMGGLPQTRILEKCCREHQLVILIDGTRPATLKEQDYLAERYYHHIKIIFFISQVKFNKFKNNPSEYFKDFPTIITYGGDKDLEDKILTFARLRIFRLADIIQKQILDKKGLYSPKYVNIEKRSKKHRKKK